MNWNKLSMAEKAAIMKIAIEDGIYDLDTIRRGYNSFAEDKENTDSRYYSTMEKVAEENYKKWGFSTPEEALTHALNDNTYNYRGYYDKYPTSEANADTHWTDEFKTVYHPTFSDESIYSGNVSDYNPQGLTGGHWKGETFIPAPWQREHNYASGGSIHIKPSHRGRLTELKARTGKSEAELYNDGNPAHKKMVVFARNARKWKHADGGLLNTANTFGGGGKKKKSGALGNQAFQNYLNQALQEDNTFNTPGGIKFLTDIAYAESRNNPYATHNSGASGIFQTMPENTSKGAYGNPILQFRDMFRLTKSNLNYLKKHLTKKDWDKAAELGIDEYGLLAGAHLGGVGGVVNALRGIKNAKDSNGTSVMSYMTRFSQNGKPALGNNITANPVVMGTTPETTFTPEQYQLIYGDNPYALPTASYAEETPIWPNPYGEAVVEEPSIQTVELSPVDFTQQNANNQRRRNLDVLGYVLGSSKSNRRNGSLYNTIQMISDEDSFNPLRLLRVGDFGTPNSFAKGGNKDDVKQKKVYSTDNYPLQIDPETGNIVDKETGDYGSIMLDGVVVTPESKTEKWSPYSWKSVVPFEYSRNSYYRPEDALEAFNTITFGGLNNLSPVQWGRRLYDLGDLWDGGMSKEEYWNRWINGNEGLVSKEYAQEHPLATAAINGTADIATFLGGAAFTKLPELRTALQAEELASRDAIASSWEGLVGNGSKTLSVQDNSWTRFLPGNGDYSFTRLKPYSGYTATQQSPKHLEFAQDVAQGASWGRSRGSALPTKANDFSLESMSSGRLGNGAEAVVVENPVNVGRVLKFNTEMSSPSKEDLIRRATKYAEERNQLPFNMPLSVEGTYQKEGQYFPVFSQERVIPINESNMQTYDSAIGNLNNSVNGGMYYPGSYRPNSILLENNFGATTDFKPANLGITSDGNIMGIDLGWDSFEDLPQKNMKGIVDDIAKKWDRFSNDNSIIVGSKMSITPKLSYDDVYDAASQGKFEMKNLITSGEYAEKLGQAYKENGIHPNQASFEIKQMEQAINDADLKVVPTLKNGKGEPLNGAYDPNTRTVTISQDRDNILDVHGTSQHEHAHATEIQKILDMLKKKWTKIKPRKEAYTKENGEIDTEWRDYISSTEEMRAPAMSVWSTMKERGFKKVGDYLDHLKKFGMKDTQWENLVHRYGLTNAKYMVETVFGLSPLLLINKGNDEEKAVDYM